MRPSITVLAIVLGLAVPLSLPASERYRIETVAEGLSHPWSLAFLPDGDMLVTERAGNLRLIREGKLLPEPIANVPEAYVASQGGMLEVLLDPAFANNRRLFLSFAYGTPRANNTRVVSARLEGHALQDVLPIFTAQPMKSTPVHYGGRMAFMADGTLLLALGDGFDYREEAQNLGSHIGSIVRINTDGSVPADNPFLDKAGALPEIYSYGHRNVQGLVVDGQSVYAHEHGPKGGDELNFISAGANYGWPIVSKGLDYTGARVTPFQQREGMVDPLLVWTPSIAPAGMARYDGSLFPEWQGDLLVTALAEKSLRRVRMRNGVIESEEVLFKERGERLRDVRVGPDGAVYLLTDDAEGRILRVTPRR
jgi:glucose/arabinose dehydrogenase